MDGIGNSVALAIFLGFVLGKRYRDDLHAAAMKSRCAIHAYVLMTNHVHLLVSSSVSYGISQRMQSLVRRYVRYINNEYQRTGTLWEGRFKAALIVRIFLSVDLHLLHRIVNPVRAAMVEHPGDYSWYSYAANAQGIDGRLVTPHPLYSVLDASAQGRRMAYRELFRHAIDSDQMHEIREALNHELVLGRSRFKDKIDAMTARRVRLGVPGQPRIREDQALYGVSVPLVY